MPEYTKLQHTIQVQATKPNTYNIQYKYNLQYDNTMYNDKHTTTTQNDKHKTTTCTLNTYKDSDEKNNKSLKSCCGSEFWLSVKNDVLRVLICTEQ